MRKDDMRKDAMTKNNDNQNCRYMTRRIGSTTYKVKVALQVFFLIYNRITVPSGFIVTREPLV